MTTRELALAAYDRLVATHPGVERKGVKLPYTSVNGNMYSFLTEDGVLALRLSTHDRQAFMDRYETGLHEAMNGTVMKEYVRVPAEVLVDTEALRPWFAQSVAYAASLKAKPTTRRSKI